MEPAVLGRNGQTVYPAFCWRRDQFGCSWVYQGIILSLFSLVNDPEASVITFDWVASLDSWEESTWTVYQPPILLERHKQPILCWMKRKLGRILHWVVTDELSLSPEAY